MRTDVGSVSELARCGIPKGMCLPEVTAALGFVQLPEWVNLKAKVLRG